MVWPWRSTTTPGYALTSTVRNFADDPPRACSSVVATTCRPTWAVVGTPGMRPPESNSPTTSGSRTRRQSSRSPVRRPRRIVQRHGGPRQGRRQIVARCPSGWRHAHDSPLPARSRGASDHAATCPKVMPNTSAERTRSRSTGDKLLEHANNAMRTESSRVTDRRIHGGCFRAMIGSGSHGPTSARAAPRRHRSRSRHTRPVTVTSHAHESAMPFKYRRDSRRKVSLTLASSAS